MQQSWLVVFPPFIVIILATITRRVLFSLITGIIAASLIVHDFQPALAFQYGVMHFWNTTELAKLAGWQSLKTGGTIFLCGFLIFLGIIITLIQFSGAAYAYGNVVMRRVKTRCQAEASSLLLSTMFFIDDYFSCLVVGAVMQPITDRFKIPRIKLGLLVNTVAAPFAILVPLSSWVTVIVGQLRNVGVDSVMQSSVIVLDDPFHLYLQAIPTMFYGLLAIFSIWFIVLGRISYGIVDAHEKVALGNGGLFGGKAPVVRRSVGMDLTKGAERTLFDFLFPIVLLFATVIGWIFVDGGWWLFGGSNSLFGAVQNAKFYQGLFISGLVTTIVTACLYLLHGAIAFKDLGVIIKEGSLLLGRTVILLWLIWTLSDILSTDLATGQYLAGLMAGKIPVVLVPALFFIMAALISLMMGTAFGTIGMLIPLGIRMIPSFLGLSVPVSPAEAPLIVILIGAIVSGSVVSNHMSPIADVMLMTSTSTGAYHLDLVKAMVSFSLPTVIASLCAFVCAGLLVNSYGLWMASLLALAVGLVINIVLLNILAFAWKRFH